MGFFRKTPNLREEYEKRLAKEAKKAAKTKPEETKAEANTPSIMEEVSTSTISTTVEDTPKTSTLDETINTTSVSTEDKPKDLKPDVESLVDDLPKKDETVSDATQASHEVPQTETVIEPVFNPFEEIRAQLLNNKTNPVYLGLGFTDLALIQAITEQNTDKQIKAMEELVNSLRRASIQDNAHDLDGVRLAMLGAAEESLNKLSISDPVTQKVVCSLRGEMGVINSTEAEEKRAKTMGDAMKELAGAMWLARGHKKVNAISEDGEETSINAAEVVMGEVVCDFDNFVTKNYPKAREKQQEREREQNADKAMQID